MKKYCSFFKSISIVLVVQAFVYFIIKLVVRDFNIIESFISIPYIKYFVYFYDIWYPFIFFSAFIMYENDISNYKNLIYTLLLGAFISHLTFLIYPTMIVRPEISVNSITDFIVLLTYESDTPAVNCLPSLHCLFCFIFMYYTFTSNKIDKKYKYLIVSILLMIVLSTLFIRQHIIEDVILSLIYTILIIFIVKKFNDVFNKYLKFLFLVGSNDDEKKKMNLL